MPSRTRLRVSVAVAVVVIFFLVTYVPDIHDGTLIPRFPDRDDIEGSFSFIYRNHIWGDPDSQVPFSGLGSHDTDVVAPYVSATRSFIQDHFDKPPNTVDLGCGDFNIGQQIRNVTDRYIACDVVSDVIEYNRAAYADQNVEFKVLNIVAEDLPAGDIVLVRQVFQHLKNTQIASVLPKLRRYRWAIITEHIPLTDPFVPNVEMFVTGSMRLMNDSGVELTLPPFNLPHLGASVLSESLAKDGRIRTTAYRMQ